MAVLTELTPVAIRIAPVRDDSQMSMAKGGLASKADAVRKAGRGGDTLLIHVNKDEYEFMRKRFGDPTVNPATGIPEFTPFWKQKWFAPVAGAVASAIGAPFVSEFLPAGITEALGSGGSQALSGGLIGAGVGALSGGAQGALTGGLAGAATPYLLNQFGISNLPSQAMDFFGGSAAAAPSTGLDAAYTAAGSPLPPVRPEGLAGAAGSGATGAATPLAQAAGASGSILKYAPLLLAASAMGGGPKQPTAAQMQPQQTQDPNMTRTLSNVKFDRTRNPVKVDEKYGYGGQQQFFSNNALPTVAAARGHYVKGGGTGTSDSIPAVLSDGEYVMDAQTVSMLGNGSSDAGADKLDKMREQLRKHKGQAMSQGKFAPNAKSPLSYMKGSK
jgi:hypothetical protein